MVSPDGEEMEEYEEIVIDPLVYNREEFNSGERTYHLLPALLA